MAKFASALLINSHPPLESASNGCLMGQYITER